MVKKADFSVIKWIAGVGTAIFLGLVGWIGMNVAHIPVIQEQITNINEKLSTQVSSNKENISTNVARLDDHEIRLRNLERK